MHITGETSTAQYSTAPKKSTAQWRKTPKSDDGENASTLLASLTFHLDKIQIKIGLVARAVKWASVTKIVDWCALCSIKEDTNREIEGSRSNGSTI